MRRLIGRFLSALVLLCMLLAGVPARRAHAAGIVVNTAADQDNWLAMVADGKCGLREAIANANADSVSYSDCAAGSGTDTITFAGNYTITLGSQGQLSVTSPIIIQGNGAANSIIQADATPFTATNRVFELDSAANLTLDSLTVRYGQCTDTCVNAGLRDEGAGVLVNGGGLTVKNSLFTFNRAKYGGGVMQYGGTLIVVNSTFRENNSTFAGGAINAAAAANVAIRSSTFSANSSYGLGGAIYSTSSLTVTNSTFSANAAELTGGGIESTGNLTLKNSTFSGNGAPQGGGVYNFKGQLNYANTIIANSNPSSDCFNDGGTIPTNVNNLVEDGSCSATFSGDPNLGPLDYYGGPTRTHALLPGSPAIDAGAAGSCPLRDQRGIARPQGPGCDIGAYELEQVAAAFTSVATQDGWIRESSETSSAGGILDSSSDTFRLGDDAGNRQWRAVLSFATGALPDTAVVTSAALKFNQQGLVGANPFSTLGKLVVDVKQGTFGGDKSLQLGDFQATASKNGVLSFGKSITGLYSKPLAQGDLAYLNKLGPTQFRLRFGKDDNNNAAADYLKFYSGDATTASYRPKLVLTYYVP